MPNTTCYFDITIGGSPAGRITFDLFDDVVPKVDPPFLAILVIAEYGIDYREFQGLVYWGQD